MAKLEFSMARYPRCCHKCNQNLQSFCTAYCDQVSSTELSFQLFHWPLCCWSVSISLAFLSFHRPILRNPCPPDLFVVWKLNEKKRHWNFDEEIMSIRSFMHFQAKNCRENNKQFDLQLSSDHLFLTSLKFEEITIKFLSYLRNCLRRYFMTIVG